MTYIKYSVLMIGLCGILMFSLPQRQTSNNVDVAVYQVGLVAEALPGSDLIYNLTVTNYGPSVVQSFYIIDGWTINDEGITAFTSPISNPDFGSLSLKGTWHQSRDDQEVIAWLLQGNLQPGDTLQFKWPVQIHTAYQGVLVNWARIQTEGALQGEWLPVLADTDPPPLQGTVDTNLDNNRTVDGVTIITTTPTGKGIDLALYQTGVLAELSHGEPLESTWLVANLGPQKVTKFYVLAGETLNSNGGSIFVEPITEPDFGNFQIIGRWQQIRQDERLWLWLLEGELAPGSSVIFPWKRTLVTDYRGDLITWARISGHNVPDGDWIGWGDTTSSPPATGNDVDTFTENDSSLETLTTILE